MAIVYDHLSRSRRQRAQAIPRPLVDEERDELGDSRVLELVRVLLCEPLDRVRRKDAIELSREQLDILADASAQEFLSHHHRATSVLLSGQAIVRQGIAFGQRPTAIVYQTFTDVNATFTGRRVHFHKRRKKEEPCIG